jgi:hypothetical protein
VSLRSVSLASGYAFIVGSMLVVIGLLAFAPNPVVGDPQMRAEPVIEAGTQLSVLHLLSGAWLLFVGLAMSGTAQAAGVVLAGALYAALSLLTIASPTVFGVFDIPVNLPAQVLHAVLAALSVAVGWLSRNLVLAARSL